MKRHAKRLLSLALAILLCRIVPAQVLTAAALPEDPLQAEVYGDTVSGGETQLPAGDGAEEAVTENAGGMLYQEGGFGTPAGEYGIATYALSSRDALKAEILQALETGTTTLNISAYAVPKDEIEEIHQIFSEVINENPSLFYVSGEYSWYHNNVNITSLGFSYKAVTDAEKQAFESKIAEAVSLVTDAMSDEEKALVLHDYLAQHCAYAYKEYTEGTVYSCPNVFNAYGALVEGKAVCQGYALAYVELLKRVGIPSYICNSASMNHAWNVVLIDGAWYHVDVTWDDPTWNKEGQVRHTYFLLSDAEMGSTRRGHSNWEDNVDCSSTKYDSTDYWWISVNSQIVQAGHDDYIYIRNKDSINFEIVRKTGAAEQVLYSSTATWAYGGGSKWPAQAFLSRQGDNLYFNDNSKLYSMSLAGGDPKAVYEYQEDSREIYGAMVYEDGTARLNIDTTPNRTTDDYITAELVKVVRVTGVSLNQSTASLELGDTLKLEATVAPADADNQRVVWRSSDGTVASIASDGTVRALKAGTATITVTTTDGGKTASCTVTVTHTHAMTKIEGAPATCETDGRVEHYTCSKCGKTYADAAGTKELTDVVIKALGHTPGEWSHNAAQHWSECIVCHKEISGVEHTFQWLVDKAATEDETGLRHEQCTVCGERRSENTVIPKLDHTHIGILHHAAVAATCIAKGNVEYWTCASAKCAGKYYSDSACQIALTVIETPVNPANHAGTGVWESTDERHQFTCSCGVKTVDGVHVYDNDGDNTCNQCGYKRFYVVTSGAGAAYELGSTSGFSIVADGEFKFFQAVEVDGSVVDPANYEVREGSTIITLKKAYLETLSLGTHDIRVLYTDGKVATSKFAVEEPDDTDDDDNNNSNSNNNAAAAGAQRVLAPRTGDTYQPAQMVMIIVVCAAMSAGILIYKRKDSCR